MRGARPPRHSAAKCAGSMSQRLVVDPIKCTAHGMCAELFPEWIGLDDWGYPIVQDGDLPDGLRRHAERAVKACPALALKLQRR